MTISSTTRKAGPFAGTGGQTAFPFTFKVFQASDVLVVLTDANGNNTTQVLTTNYTVSLNADQNSTPGGTVTMLVAPPLGYTLTIGSQVPYTQTLDLTNLGGFYPDNINDALDRQAILAQQLLELESRTLKIAISTPSGVDTTLPTPAANKLIGWNPTATGLQNMDPTVLATIVAFGTANADVFTGDGVRTSWTLSANPGNQANLDVSAGGITQTPGVDYVWSGGTTLTTTSAIPNGVKLLVRYFQGLPQGTTDSAASTFTQSVTGAVQRTVQAKLRDSLGVKDLGVAADGVTDDATNFQKAVDASGGLELCDGTYQLGRTIQIKNGTRRTTLRGLNRILTILQPNAVNIASAPTNVNALFINQDNNSHFCIENLRMTAINGYTGIGIYCVEGGAGDGSGQCIFSGIFKNLWIDFNSTNTGFLTGGTQNTIFDTITFENMKGCFTLAGTGNGDNFYKTISLYNCYDQFILQTADANGSFAATVSDLHAYSHNRGRLFDVQNWTGSTISNVMLESQSGAVLGDAIGMGRFKNCQGLQLTNLYGLTRAGVPALATGLEFEGCTGVEVVNALLTAYNPLRINGTSTVDLSFVNCDFSTAGDSCFVIAAALAGTIRTRGCKFNNAQLRCMVNTVAGGSFSWYSYGDEFINAGLGGSAAARNLDINTSGTVKLYSPRIGQNNVSAAAGYYVAASGGGTVDIYDPEWIGTPPSGLIDPASTIAITIHRTPETGVQIVTAGTATVLDSAGEVLCNFAGVVTLTLPAASTPKNVGRVLTIKTVTANAVNSASSNVEPLTTRAPGTAIVTGTAGKYARVRSDGSNWIVMEAN